MVRSTLLAAIALTLAAAAAAGPLHDAVIRLGAGVLVVRTAPDPAVTVEPLRHDFRFGATIGSGILDGRFPVEDVAC